MRWLNLAVLTASLVFIGVTAMASQPYDFRAFYCAGRVSRLGADPYRTQPLYACEQKRTETNKTWLTNGPLPAPFPPYVIATVFEPISRAAYPFAASIWMLALLASLGVSVVLLAKVGRCDPSMPAAALCLSAGIASVSFGEIVPLFFVCLCGTVYAALHKQWRFVGIVALGTLIEPHIGLPVCAALALFQPRCRLPLAAGVATLGAISLSTLGWDTSLEYLYPVLHFHALSEIGSDRQFALSTVLHWLGVADNAALAIGLMSYVVAVLGGIVTGRDLERRFGEPAFLVAAPAAFALLGGVFLHVTQMIAALPLALLLLRELPRAKTPLAAAMALLAVPWIWELNTLDTVASVLVTLAIAWEATHARTFLIAAAPALAFIALFFVTGTPGITAAPLAGVHTAIDPAFSERGWAEQIARYVSTGSADAWARRAPTWAGLLFIVAASVASRTARREIRLDGRRFALAFSHTESRNA